MSFEYWLHTSNCLRYAREQTQIRWSWCFQKLDIRIYVYMHIHMYMYTYISTYMWVQPPSALPAIIFLNTYTHTHTWLGHFSAFKNKLQKQMAPHHLKHKAPRADMILYFNQGSSLSEPTFLDLLTRYP